MNEYKSHILNDTFSCLTDKRAGDDNCASDLKTEHSYEKKALLAHLRNNFDILSKQQKSIIQKLINDFATEENRFADDTGSLIAADLTVQYDLFSSLDKAPFHDHEQKFKFIDLFAGIGGIRLPFSELGGRCVFSSEWDKNAQKTYISNFGDIPFGDITKIREDFIPSHDILLAGFPCQAFSIIGKMRGFEDTRGTMFFEVARILRYHRPKAFLLENVKNLAGHDQGRTLATILKTLDELGYHVQWKIMNALDFGLPQKRERIIIVGFLDKQKSDKFNFTFEKTPYDLNNILENDETVDPALFASEDIQKKRLNRVQGKKVFYPSVWHENKSGNISVLPYACALRTGASYNYLLINGYRRPSSKELLRFQGFPEEFLITVSHSEIRRQTGNSVAVPMIKAVAKKIINLL